MTKYLKLVILEEGNSILIAQDIGLSALSLLLWNWDFRIFLLLGHGFFEGHIENLSSAVSGASEKVLAVVRRKL